ncbi:MAG TPA: aminotransferase class V-fold PLP-dependent enzyme [Micromonosporaceae bacterium]|jgi:kynureninase
MTQTITREARAQRLDRTDPLRRFAAAFVKAPDVVSYLDGNSLGRPLKSFATRVRQFSAQDWGTRLIRRWDEEWMAKPYVLGDRIGAALLGAAPGQTFVGDSTTVLLYKLIRAAVDHQPGRSEIIIDDDNFPTDRFVVEGIAAERGLTIRWITSDRTVGVQLSQVEDALSDRTAAVVLSHVAYRSAAIADMAGITAAAHRVGALMLWDLCHSIGSVPVRLDECGVDLAVGCSYKYLNGGPGAPAIAYVNSSLQPSLSQPIWGWMGAADVFAMKAEYEPADDLRRFVSGTPPILAMLAMEAMLELIEQVGIEAVRAKSVALTAFAWELLESSVLPMGATMASPADPAVRGSHLMVTHPAFRAVVARLWERGVIPDFRAPDGIRLGLSPLSTTFAEVEVGVRAIAEELETHPAQA